MSALPLDFSENDSLGLLSTEKQTASDDFHNIINSKIPEVIKTDSGIYLDADDMLVDTATTPAHIQSSISSTLASPTSLIPAFYFPYGSQGGLPTNCKFNSIEFEVFHSLPMSRESSDSIHNRPKLLQFLNPHLPPQPPANPHSLKSVWANENLWQSPSPAVFVDI